jgi:hypothetical protein
MATVVRGMHLLATKVSVSDYGGNLDKAQDALVKIGGGVLFLPAGTYQLNANFVIASNVVLRGAPVKGMAKSSTKPGDLSPTSVKDMLPPFHPLPTHPAFLPAMHGAMLYAATVMICSDNAWFASVLLTCT